MRRTTILFLSLFLIGVIQPGLINSDFILPADGAAGRSSDGAEVRLKAIIEPAASVGDMWRDNAMLLGDSSEILVNIENIGNKTITDLTIMAGIYRANGDGDQASTVPLWETPELSPVDTLDSNTHAAPNSSISNDRANYRLVDTNDVPYVWKPDATGLYLLIVEIDSSTDGDVTNNKLTRVIRVKDWSDIDVELLWDEAGYEEGAPAELDTDAGNGPHAFTLRIYVNSSQPWMEGRDYNGPRNITIALDIEGDGVNSDGTVLDCADIMIDCDRVENFPGRANISVGMVEEVIVYQNMSQQSGGGDPLPPPTGRNRYRS